MTGPEHYRMAEQCLDQAHELVDEEERAHHARMELYSKAQAHASLAHAAATALAAESQIVPGETAAHAAMDNDHLRAWRRVATN